MSIRLDSSCVEIPWTLAGQIVGALMSGCGVIGTTLLGAAADDLTIQPLHVILITFIIGLAGFIVLILRTVWNRGISTVEDVVGVLKELKQSVDKMSKSQEEYIQSVYDLSLDTLKDASFASKQSRIDKDHRS